MLWQSDDGTTICTAPSAHHCLTSSPSEFKLSLLLARLTWAVAVWQKTSLLCAQRSLTRVGGSYISSSMFASVLLVFATRWLLLYAGVSEMCAFTTWPMTRNMGSSSTELLLLLVVKCSDSASEDWCFIPARWMKLKSKSNKRRRLV